MCIVPCRYSGANEGFEGWARDRFLMMVALVCVRQQQSVLIFQDMSSMCPQGCLDKVGAEATRYASFVQRAGVAQVSAMSSF